MKNNRRSLKKIEALKALGLKEDTELFPDTLYRMLKSRGYMWNESTCKWVSLDEPENRLYPISVRVDHELYHDLKTVARLNDLTLSELVERYLREGLENKNESGTTELAEIKSLLINVLDYLTQQ